MIKTSGDGDVGLERVRAVLATAATAGCRAGQAFEHEARRRGALGDRVAPDWHVGAFLGVGGAGAVVQREACWGRVWAAADRQSGEGGRVAEVLVDSSRVGVFDDGYRAAVGEIDLAGPDEVFHRRGTRVAGAAAHAFRLAERGAHARCENARGGQVDPRLTELADAKRLVGRGDRVRHRYFVHLRLGKAGGGQGLRRTPAGRAVLADVARPRGDPLPHRQRRYAGAAALEVVHEQQVTRGPLH